MIKVNITRHWRGTKVHDTVQKQVSHCALHIGHVSAYAVGNTDRSAKRKAQALLGVHIHALSKQDSERRKTITYGIPAGYKLASEA